MIESILRCTWCCKDTKTKPCEHCGNDMTVVDPKSPHLHEWSRRTIDSVECKQCDKVISMDDYLNTKGNYENATPDYQKKS